MLGFTLSDLLQSFFRVKHYLTIRQSPFQHKMPQNSSHSLTINWNCSDQLKLIPFFCLQIAKFNRVSDFSLSSNSQLTVFTRTGQTRCGNLADIAIYCFPIDKNLLIKQTQLHVPTTMKRQDRQQLQPQPILSPTHFMLRSPEPELLSDLKIEPSPLEELPSKELQDAAKTSSRDEKKRLAGARSREKKKRYVEQLQQSVKQLQTQVEEYEAEISKSKNQLFQAIQTSNKHSNEHAYTFSQLQKNINDEDPDLDKINLLLDIIQNRIGANARERQANLDYCFKQMINSIFPAMHRYILHSAHHSYDLFDPSTSAENITNRSNGSWTQELFSKLQLNEQQLAFIKKHEEKMVNKRRQTISFIRRLKTTKGELKQQQQIFQQKISQFRQDMTPIQSGRMAIFGQKNKLRRQFAMGEQFEDPPSTKKIKME